MDDKNPKGEAVAITGGKIAGIGTNSQVMAMKQDGTIAIDLNGKTVLPGFHDSHLHFIGYGLTLQMVPLSGVTSIAEMKKRIAAAADNVSEGDWIVGSGWDHNLFTEARYPNRLDLDEASPRNPVALTRICGHLQVANSRALSLAGIDSESSDPPGGQIDRDSSGQPTGVLRETATRLVMKVMPPPFYDKLYNALKLAVSDAHRFGITSVTTDDIRADRVHHLSDNLKLYHQLWEEGLSPVRVTLEIRDLIFDELMAAGYRTGSGDDRVKIGNLKIFQDGALGARTAFLREPYQNDPQRGIPIHPQDELNEWVAKGHNAGLQVAIHAIGDAATDYCLNAYEKAQAEMVRDDPRHRIVHYNVVDKAMLERTKKLGVIADIQTTFVPLNGQWVNTLLGEDRARRTYAWKTIMDAGVICSGGSDCPITPLPPLLGIWAAVTRHAYYTNESPPYLPEECLSVQQAVELYTKWAAYADFDEDKKGTVSVGKYADLVVLEEDIFQVAPDQIKDIGIHMTIVDGQIVYQKSNRKGE